MTSEASGLRSKGLGYTGITEFKAICFPTKKLVLRSSPPPSLLTSHEAGNMGKTMNQGGSGGGRKYIDTSTSSFVRVISVSQNGCSKINTRVNGTFL